MRETLRKSKNMRIIKILLPIVFFIFSMLSVAEKQVAGIELKQHFSNLNLQSIGFDYDVQKTYIPINYFFGKIKLPVPKSILAKYNCFYTSMELNDDEWIVSLLDNGFKEYDYLNVYWEGDEPVEIGFFAKYYNLCLELPILKKTTNSQKILIKNIGPLYPSTMHFIEVSFDFSNFTSQSVEPETTLTSFNGNYPNSSFVNDLLTDVVVKVIAPNNPHYDDYCAYLNGENSISSIFTNLVNWSEYAVEVSLKAGESLAMPDSNNVITVNANFSGDKDGDGLSNVEEIFLYGTDPTNTDTDEDGLTDDLEVYDQNIVLQFPSGDETITVNTMPTWYDTDGDGITDGDEVLGLYPYITNEVESHYVTNPCSDDTDDDGLTDDVDPHPLNPCNNQNATAINTDWLSYWQEIAQKAGLNISNLSDPFADSDMDGINNLTEMKNKSNPIFTNGFRKIVFEPTEIHFSLIENTTITNFYLNVFSSDTVTGAVYISSLDWHPLLEMNGFSVLWEDCPLDPSSTTFLTYSVNNYKRLNFGLMLEHSKMNNAVRAQDIQVVDSRGPYGEKLPFFWDAEDGTIVNYAPSKPVLLEPSNCADVYLELPEITENNQDFEEIHFVWAASEDPENDSISYELNLSCDVLETILITNIFSTNVIISTESLSFDRGYYYWQVIAEDSSHNKRCSNINSFFVNIAGDEDGDGFEDNEEIKRGYNPFDASNFPLSIETSSLENAIVGGEYFSRLKANGGNSKRYLWLMFNENELPPGLRLNSEGELRGVPTVDGTFTIDVYVCDGKDITVKKLNLTILPERDGLILKPGEGKIEQKD